MHLEEALALVLREGYAEDGLPVCVWRGDDPGAARVRCLLLALRVIFDSLQGQSTLDRKLASALYTLSAYVFVPVACETPSPAWREEFVRVEAFQLGAAVESIFQGIWVEWV